MNVIKRFFSAHYLKVVSLILAILLWFVAMNNYDPIQKRSFSMKLQLKNLEQLGKNQYLLANEKDLEQMTVSIIVNDRKSITDKLALVSNQITASVDLGPIDYSMSNRIGENLTATVDYQLPKDFDSKSILYRSTDAVPVILDKDISVEKEIAFVREGKAAAGFTDMRETIEPASVKISGAQTVINTIREVRVVGHLDSATQDIQKKMAVIVEDGNGKDITANVSIDYPSVMVTIPIYKIGKLNFASPTYTGNVAEGYEIKQVVLEPSYIEVVGREEDINKFGELHLKTFDVQDLKANFSQEVNITDYLKGSNLSILNGTAEQIVITFEIAPKEEEITHDFVVPIARLQIKNQKNAIQIRQQEFAFALQGSKTEINRLIQDGSSLGGSIDLQGLPVGNNEVQIQPELPEGIKLVGEAPVVEVQIYNTTDTTDATNTTNTTGGFDG